MRRYKVKYTSLWLSMVWALLTVCQGLWAQGPLGTEWLDLQRDYYKVEVAQEGVYRLYYNTLQDADFPIESLRGEQIELYNMGRPILIRVSTPGVFGPDDFIEFYGTANDGELDAQMYEYSEGQQLNPFKSLYDQHRAYYLTWSDSVSEYQYKWHDNGLNNGGLPLVEEYYIHKERIVFDEVVNKPSRDGANQIRYSTMDIGEGYGTRPKNFNKINIPISFLSNFGKDPKLTLRFGTNAWSRIWEIKKDGDAIKNLSKGDISLLHYEQEFPREEIKGNNVSIEVRGIHNANERHSLGYVELTYPRLFEFGNSSFNFFTQHPSILPRYVEYKKFKGEQPMLYNLSRGFYMIPERSGAVVRTVIPVSSDIEEWVLVDQEQGIKLITGIKKVKAPAATRKQDYLIFSHGDLIQSGAVQAYADYRTSAEGGGFDVGIVDVLSLYDHYAYGNKGHPLAIKNYVEDLRRQGQLPDYVFLIGKGYEYPELDKIDVEAYVPTFGYPGSDNLLFAREDAAYPEIPVGRLAAQTPAQIIAYLDKVKLQEQVLESAQDIYAQAWKKKILHMSGGNSRDQEVLFRFLNNMGEVIENNTFGAEIHTFRKTSSDPFATIESEEIISEIDKGATLLTFFGHSAVGTFDFSLENPSDYSNQGKNPIILSLGCHSGNVHTLSQGISEEFVLEPETGGIVFIASSGTAYPEPQYRTGLHFYDLFGEQLYGGRIGQILQLALEERGDSELRSEQTLAQQITLHGDPAFQYQAFSAPDYIIDNSSVQVNPGLVNVNTGVISLEFDILNMGRMVDEPLDIRLIHLLPDGTPYDTVNHTVLAPGYRESVQIDLNNPGLIGVGANSILLDLDIQNFIPEAPSHIAEFNNSYVDNAGNEGLQFFIFDQSAKPSSPSNYGIVGDRNVKLEATLSNGLLTQGSYVFQIDTTELFDSPSLIEANVTTESSIVSWQPNINWANERVYYWRIAPKSATETLKAINWKQSSFVFVDGLASGWNQSHFFQLKDANYEAISLSPDTRKMEFDKRIWDVRIKNEIKDNFDYWVFVNNTPWQSLNPIPLAPALSIFIFDPKTTLFNNKGTDYGSLEYDRDGFLYKMDKTADRENVAKLLEKVRPGSRVFIHTLLEDEASDLHVYDWLQDGKRTGTTLYDVLESYGATKVRGLLDKGTVPYTFVFDKGEGVVFEDIANSIHETLDMTSKAATIWHKGRVYSELIGPASEWTSLSWSEDLVRPDDTKLNIYGVNESGQEHLIKTLRGNYNSNPENYNYNLEDLNAEIYPHLRLEYVSEDFTDRSSAQLKSWRVTYAELPDAALFSNREIAPLPDTIDEGVPLDINYQIHNLGGQRMKPIEITYSLLGLNGDEKTIVKSSGWHIPAGAAQDIQQVIDTEGLSGAYQLVIELNSDQAVTEITDCNNFGYREIYIRSDERNPFLTVTFDGKRIRDGEHVGSNPEIKITLDDPGSNLLLDDPSDFDIVLYYPEILRWLVDYK